MSYDFKKIEDRWKPKWYENNIYKAVDFSDKPKKYILAEFPYPSGKSMHMGHMMRYTVPDMYSRYLRMQGYNVMYPMGWDAFGLPAENYAIKTGEHPSTLTSELVGYYRTAMQDIGYGIDWDREVNTTDPSYYKWTQWIFLKFYEAGLAELREEPVWWSEKMKTVLAEEEVEKDADGNLVAERDGSPVVRKMIKQWVLKMPEYADQLIAGLDTIDFPDSIKAAQVNWIGRKEGANIKYPVVGMEDEVITCFTTRPDTNFGATFVVLSPEHEFVTKIVEGEIEVDNFQDIDEYVSTAKAKTDLERMSEGKVKTGVNTGFKVRNPLSGRDMELWVSDFVLPHFGTGAVVGVPAHDIRDFQFATKFGIEVIRVIEGEGGDRSEISDDSQVYEDYGVVYNSDFLDGMSTEEAIDKVIEHIESNGYGEKKVTYSLRDWIFSRQRYWGEPIPLIHDSDGNISAIASTDDPQSIADNLPLELPELPDYSPTDDGASPLASNHDWVETEIDGKKYERETNTMPNWAGSCWYYLRYIDPHNDEEFADMDKMKYWLPVDKYFGGSEHTTMHLLYSRFWHQFLYDQGVVPTPEPYQWRMNGGLLLGPDGSKMSKSVGNVIIPKEKMEKYGSDAVRLYAAFMGPYNGTFPYNESSLQRCYKLVKDTYELRTIVSDSAKTPDEFVTQLHKSIKNITEMAEALKMNTYVSELMILVNHMKELDELSMSEWKTFIKLLAPLAVFTAEELWQEANGYTDWVDENSVHLQEWPEYDPGLVRDDVIEIPVQVNGKLRGQIQVDADASREDVEEVLYDSEQFADYFTKDSVKKVIYVEGKIVNVIA